MEGRSLLRELQVTLASSRNIASGLQFSQDRGESAARRASGTRLGRATRRGKLHQLEQECLNVCRRTVDEANWARLHQLLADSESELASRLPLLDDRPCMAMEGEDTSIWDEMGESDEERDRMLLQLEQECLDVYRRKEMSSGTLQGTENGAFCWKDLSLRKLHEYRCQLQELQDEKSSRLHKVSELLEVLHGYCVLLGADYTEVFKEVHSSLCDPGQLEKLAKAVEDMKNEKSKRLQKIHNLVALLCELWNLMDTSLGKRQPFRNIIRNLLAPEPEPSSLTLKTIAQAEKEVDRISRLIINKMKELVLKKQAELEETCNMAHLECSKSNSRKRGEFTGVRIVDLSELLGTIESSIAEAKKESLGRQDLMERMERWISACEEENWLEGYNKDEGRFKATRGAHLNRKRAERARVIVAKLPNLLESLKSTIQRTGYVSLLAILEEYSLLGREKEERGEHKEEEKKDCNKHTRIEDLRPRRIFLAGNTINPFLCGVARLVTKITY
ncbi:hypothetical protein SELMODRAFT_423605 [Selaginella moellendorffii]|uniref:Uncharacterized protein n=1 Tax=Selaginella moellendorffii TaxID=88036 RepID=D8SM86_SELML|nr:hypothetical protein SELMODRAFT_423605 [Selaginella moellendorffii]